MGNNGDREGQVGDPLRGLRDPDLPGPEDLPPASHPVAPELRRQLPAEPGSVDAYKGWPAEAQQRALDMLRTARATRKLHRPFYCPVSDCDGRPHEKWNWSHARANQHPPSFEDDWLTWLMLGGRGSGKTRAGAELTHRMTRIAPRIALIGPTGPDIREY